MINRFKHPLSACDFDAYKGTFDTLSNFDKYQYLEYLDYLISEYDRLFKTYKAYIQIRIINSMVNNIKENNTKDLYGYLVKTLNFAITFDKDLLKVNNYENYDYKLEEIDNSLDSNQVLNLIKEKYTEIVNLNETCEQLMYRLINTSCTYLYNLYDLKKFSSNKYQKILAKYNATKFIKVPEIMIGKKDRSNNWITNVSYLRYITAFNETIKLIDTQYYYKSRM